MTGVYDTCAECGIAIVHQPGRGKARKYCGPTCQSKSNSARAEIREFRECYVDGCSSPAVRVGHAMCESHYYRMRRNGTTDHVGRALPGDLMHSNGYVLQAAKGHPRAIGGYRAYQHRVVFADAHGEGPFDCHWCGVVVTWSDMHVDHVDANRANNALSNLVASCPKCNQKRGHESMKRTIRDRLGITVNGVTRTIKEWADICGISRASVAFRIKSGWTLDRAVTEPRGKFGPKGATNT